MKVALDRKRFGPWALVTGASSGIGEEFAQQIAASGINVVLVARRESLLDEVGQGLAKSFSVQYRNVAVTLGTADARVLRRTEQGVEVEARLHNSLGELIASATGRLESLDRLTARSAAPKKQSFLATVWSALEAISA